MIGYYVHHVGLGHLHRALAVVPHLDEPATVLSSLPDDDRWPGAWVRLPRDDDPRDGPPRHPTGGGQLHWAPVNHPGLRARMYRIADWVHRHHPSVMVVDLSVEVALLTRLLGVPVVMVTLPGERDDDAHRRGYELADAIVAPWPARFTDLGPSLASYVAKVHHVGAVSRFETRRTEPLVERSTSGRPHALTVSGAGGGLAPVGLTPGWEWTAIGPGRWVADPWPALLAADVVVTHAGLGSLADVAVAGRAAVVVPQARPHEEQVTTGRVLSRADLATVVPRPPARPARWAALLEEARARGGDRWSAWADGTGGERMARVIQDVAAGAR